MRRRTLRFFVLFTATLLGCIVIHDEAQSQDGFDTRAWENFAVPTATRPSFAQPSAMPVIAEPSWKQSPASTWQSAQIVSKPAQRNIADDLLQSKHRYEPPMPWIFPRDEITIKPAPPMPANISKDRTSVVAENTALTPATSPNSLPTSSAQTSVATVDQTQTKTTSTWQQPAVTPIPQPQTFPNQVPDLASPPHQSSSGATTLNSGHQSPAPTTTVAPSSVQPVRQASTWDSPSNQTRQPAPARTVPRWTTEVDDSEAIAKSSTPKNSETKSASNSTKNKSTAWYWGMIVAPLLLPILIWALWPESKKKEDNESTDAKPARESRAKKARAKALDARKKSRVEAAEKVMTAEEKSIAEKLQLDFGESSATQTAPAKSESTEQDDELAASVRNVLETTKYQATEAEAELPPIEPAHVQDATSSNSVEPAGYEQVGYEQVVDSEQIEPIESPVAEPIKSETVEPKVPKTVSLESTNLQATATELESGESQEDTRLESIKTRAIDIDPAPSADVEINDRQSIADLHSFPGVTDKPVPQAENESSVSFSLAEPAEPTPSTADTGATPTNDAPPVKLDDFTKLGGIDVVLQQVLYNSGYYEYEDLKYADANDLQQIVDTIDRQPSFNVGDWSRRAAFAQRQDWKGLKEYRRITEVGAAAGFGQPSSKTSVSKELEELRDALDGSSNDSKLESSLLEVAKAMVEKGTHADAHVTQKTN